MKQNTHIEIHLTNVFGIEEGILYVKKPKPNHVFFPCVLTYDGDPSYKIDTNTTWEERSCLQLYTPQPTLGLTYNQICTILLYLAGCQSNYLAHTITYNRLPHTFNHKRPLDPTYQPSKIVMYYDNERFGMIEDAQGHTLEPDEETLQGTNKTELEKKWTELTPWYWFKSLSLPKCHFSTHCFKMDIKRFQDELFRHRGSVKDFFFNCFTIPHTLPTTLFTVTDIVWEREMFFLTNGTEYFHFDSLPFEFQMEFMLSISLFNELAGFKERPKNKGKMLLLPDIGSMDYTTTIYNLENYFSKLFKCELEVEDNSIEFVL